MASQLGPASAWASCAASPAAPSASEPLQRSLLDYGARRVRIATWLVSSCNTTCALRAAQPVTTIKLRAALCCLRSLGPYLQRGGILAIGAENKHDVCAYHNMHMPSQKTRTYQHVKQKSMHTINHIRNPTYEAVHTHINKYARVS